MKHNSLEIRSKISALSKYKAVTIVVDTHRLFVVSGEYCTPRMLQRLCLYHSSGFHIQWRCCCLSYGYLSWHLHSHSILHSCHCRSSQVASDIYSSYMFAAECILRWGRANTTVSALATCAAWTSACGTRPLNSNSNPNYVAPYVIYWSPCMFTKWLTSDIHVSYCRNGDVWMSRKCLLDRRNNECLLPELFALD